MKMIASKCVILGKSPHQLVQTQRKLVVQGRRHLSFALFINISSNLIKLICQSTCILIYFDLDYQSTQIINQLGSILIITGLRSSIINLDYQLTKDISIYYFRGFFDLSSQMTIQFILLDDISIYLLYDISIYPSEGFFNSSSRRIF